MSAEDFTKYAAAGTSLLDSARMLELLIKSQKASLEKMTLKANTTQLGNRSKYQDPW